MTNGGPDCQANGATLLPSTHSSSHQGSLGCQTEVDSRDSDEDGTGKKRTMGTRRREKGRREMERRAVKREQGGKNEWWGGAKVEKHGEQEAGRET